MAIFIAFYDISPIGKVDNAENPKSQQSVTTTAVSTSTSSTMPSAPEPVIEKDPTPPQPLDEVDMFSQALMQLSETNKQVRLFSFSLINHYPVLTHIFQGWY